MKIGPNRKSRLNQTAKLLNMTQGMIPQKSAPWLSDMTNSWRDVGEVLWISFPIIVGLASTTAMDFVDALMVSRVDEDSFAAFGAGAAASFVISAFIFGTGRCTSTFVSQDYGRNNLGDCGRYTWQGIFFAVMMQIIVLGFIPLAPHIFSLQLFNHTPHVQKLETHYFQIRMLHALGSGGFVALASFFQGTQRTTIPMYCAIAANIVNLAASYTFIFGNRVLGIPEFGVAGSAIGTAIASYFQMLMLFGFFIRKSERRQYNTVGSFGFDPRRFVALLRIGLPSGVSFMLDVGSSAMFTLAVIGRVGTSALAANTAAGQLMEVSFMPAVGFSQGVSVLVGKYIGARNFDVAKRRFYSSLALGMLYMTTMGLIFLLFRHDLIRLFRDESDVVLAGGTILIFAAIFQAFDGLGIISQGALRGAGDTRFPAIVTIVCGWCIFVPLGFLLTRGIHWGVAGAWAAATIDILIIGIVCFARFLSERWRSINIFAGAETEPTPLPPPSVPSSGP